MTHLAHTTLAQGGARRLGLAALALAGCVAAGCATPGEAGQGSVETAERAPVRLVAANLTSGKQQSYDPGHGARILEGIDPDVVMIQEFNVGENTPEEIESFVHSTFGEEFSYVRGSAPNLPNGIVSRFPILESGVWNDPHVNNRDFPYARLDIPGKRDLWVVSVHFLTTSSGNRSAEAREVVQRVRQEVPDEDYLAVGGDFNTSSRSENAIRELSEIVETSGPHPADRHGTEGTNASRSKPYDQVLVDEDLAEHQTETVLGQSEFPDGAVIDTRVYEPISELEPARRGDSGAPYMQHMAVVRDYELPSSGEPRPDAAPRDPVDAGGTPDATPDGGLADAAPPPVDGEPSGEAHVIVNEVLANEPGSDTRKEFVEIVNAGQGTADLDGWTIADADSVRHEFFSTELAPGEARVVFADASAIPPELAGAEAASTGVLSFANGGDSVVLRDAAGDELDRLDYGSYLSGEDGVSMNRRVEADASAEFVLHTELADEGASPGTRADGTPF